MAHRLAEGVEPEREPYVTGIRLFESAVDLHLFFS